MVGDAGPNASGDLSVRFWGTRGSVPRPGPDTQRYGGNTSCVEVRLGERLFIVDAGSGIIDAGRSLLDSMPARLDILFSHLHHDHVLGLPFFPPALRRDCTIRTFCGNLDGASAEAPLNAMFAPPLFPVTLSALPCTFSHHGFRSGMPLTFEDGITIQTCPLVHPGGATAFRFDHGGRSVCYVSDLEHVPDALDPTLVAFCRNADLIIYDAMFTDTEFWGCRGWGHSTWGAGVDLCKAASAKTLGATHHHLRHNDMMLERIDEQLQAALPGSFVAREGLEIRLAPREA